MAFHGVSEGTVIHLPLPSEYHEVRISPEVGTYVHWDRVGVLGTQWARVGVVGTHWDRVGVVRYTLR